MFESQHHQKFLPMAVVGMSCNLPGARDLNEYWSLLYNGQSGIIPFPEDRLDTSLYYTESRGQFGKTYCKVAGIVDHQISEKNSGIITQQLQNSYDLCQITLLDVVLSAVRDAGWKHDDLAGTRTGIYIGNSDCSELPAKLIFHSQRNYLSGLMNYLPADLFPDENTRMKMISHIEKEIEKNYPSLGESSLVEFASNATASLVAQVLKTTGPCMALDAACASSSVALLSAQHALKSNRVDTAIVGAASFRTWCELVMLSQIQSIGTVQSCPFDSAADGFIGADGYAAVILKSLDKAIKDGDQIHGVIQSIGFSSDGRGKSFWAPRMEGQSLAIKRAYENGMDPSRLQYIETHATSTQLGDATEMQSLMNSLGDKVSQKIPIASVKANIGHSLETAGLASLIKVLLGMKNGIIPPAINISSLNKEINWDAVPFYPPMEPVEWPEFSDGHPRRAGINAFGIGGLNSHLIVDQFNDQTKSCSASVPENTTQEERQTYSGRIAVIGMGCLFPGAFTVEEFWKQLLNCQSAIEKIPQKKLAERKNHEFTDIKGISYGPEFMGGLLNDWEFDWKKHKIPPKQLANANPIQFMVLDAAAQAMADAGYDQKEYDRTKVGTIVGSIFSSNFAADTFLAVRLPEICKMISEAVIADEISTENVEQICSEYSKELLHRIRASQDESASFNSSTIASRITKVFDLMGGAFAVDAGNASSLAALNTSMDLLNNHVNDMVICASGHQKNDQISYEQYAKNGVLAKENILSPFDSGHDGIVPGEGAAVVILKRLEDAQRDGDHIYGVLNQAVSNTNSDSSTDAFSSSIHELSSNIEAGQEILMEINGSASHMKECLLEISENETSEKNYYLSSLVSQFGDLGGLSGMASLIKNLKSIQEGTIPATYGLESVSPELLNSIGDSQFVQQLVNVSDKESLQAIIASENNNGFQNEGGNAWSMMVSSKEQALKNPSSRQKTIKPNEEELANILIQLAVEQTGFPIEIINLDSTFEYDFHWQTDNFEEFIKRLKSIFTIEENILQVSDITKLKSLKDLLDIISDHVTLHVFSKSGNSNDTATVQYLLRAVETPLLELNQIEVNQPVVIIGSEMISGGSLNSRDDVSSYYISSALPAVQIIAELEKIAQQNSTLNLIVESSENDSATLSRTDVFQIVQKWLAIGESSQSGRGNSLTLITSMGGDLGVSGRSSTGQSLVDWFELISLFDQKKTQFKIIDFPSRDPKKLVLKLISTELDSGNVELFVGYIRGKRHALRAIPQSKVTTNQNQIKLIEKLQEHSGFVKEIFPDDLKLNQYEKLSSRLSQSGLIEDAVISDSGKIICHTEFTPMNEPFLDGHRVDGFPLLPAVVAIETMVESAFIASNAKFVTSVKNLKLVNGFRMPLEQKYNAKVDTTVDGNLVSCELKGDFYDKNYQFIEPHRLYQSAGIEVSDQPIDLSTVTLNFPTQGEWRKIRYADHWTRLEEGDSTVVYFGSEHRALKEIQCVENGAWARLIAPHPTGIGGKRSEGCRWHFPSALFDGMLFCTDQFAAHSLNSFFHLPSEIESIQFSQLPEPGESIIGWAQYLGGEKRKLFFDIWLFKTDGTVILQCKNFALVKLK